MQCNVFVVHYADTSFSFHYFLPSLTLIRHRRPQKDNHLARAEDTGTGLNICLPFSLDIYTKLEIIVRREKNVDREREFK